MSTGWQAVTARPRSLHVAYHAHIAAAAAAATAALVLWERGAGNLESVKRERRRGCGALS